MTHEEAVRIMAAEAYLLEELTEEESVAFEKHYFDCARCTEDVTDGVRFLVGLQIAARKGRLP